SQGNPELQKQNESLPCSLATPPRRADSVRRPRSFAATDRASYLRVCLVGRAQSQGSSAWRRPHRSRHGESRPADSAANRGRDPAWLLGPVNSWVPAVSRNQALPGIGRQVHEGSL